MISIKHLLKQSQLNPYNRNTITNNDINNINKLINIYESHGHILDIQNKLPKDTYTIMKHKCIKIFQRMDEINLYTQPRWFLDLSIGKLRLLYSYIEDIWNYRAMLTNVQKLKYTKTGVAFNYKISKINKINNKNKLQTLLLNEFAKFAFEGKTKDDCITACYWILTGLTMVSSNAAEGMPELVQSQQIN